MASDSEHSSEETVRELRNIRGKARRVVIRGRGRASRRRGARGSRGRAGGNSGQSPSTSAASVENMASGPPKLNFDPVILTNAGIDAATAETLNKFLQDQVIAATSNIRISSGSNISAPHYDGERMSSVTYFKQLENFFSVSGIKASDYHTAVGTVLKGDKKIWYDNVATSIDSWDKFKDSFKARFDSVHIQERRRNLLYHKWQRLSDPVDSFVNEMVNLSKQCYPTDLDNMHVLRAKSKLWPELREKIHIEDETKLTINMLLEKSAMAIETQRDKDRHSNRHTQMPSLTTYTPKPLQTHPIRRNTFPFRGRGYRGRGTFTYGQPTPGLSNNPPPFSQPSFQQPSSSSYQGQMNEQPQQFRERINSEPTNGSFRRTFDKSRIKCHTCGMLGHFSFECSKFQNQANAIGGSSSQHQPAPTNYNSYNQQQVYANTQQSTRGQSSRNLNYRGRGNQTYR